ncbi:MAG: T9SS type A sorting domain-containing protein, partial [Cytophagales bacterium]|nr:T9SS type A sorting domain-containing protein [Cytophagales bacterium]
AISDPLPMCLPIPALSRSNDVLTVNEPGQQYEWYFKGNLIGGATRQALTAQQSGEYSVIMTFEDGCAMESFPVTVCIPYPFITQDEETGVLFANPPVAQAYQWYNDSIPLPDEDLNVFIPGTPGLYRVEITDFDDCTAISEGFVVPEITGLLDEAYGINIYPNPARDKLHIRLPPGQQAKALVYDLNGNRVEQASVVGRADINIQHLVPGTYMFQLLLENETLTVKIQKE